ncbi:RNA-binding protein Pasilla-like isoform X8 [Octopus vulgaris]|uniref:RNA-binding protein Pasilla-like isoform X8 n=1 Tax=Octopus vulgaris TaxID=6645 RepID=A0AA36AV39_OCTVU|nr:RNA-binding protein Pasilla-like isoform X8 [Octopus vulgaris]
MNASQSGGGGSMGSDEIYTCDYKSGDSSSGGSISLKILVPNAIAGAIIGKGGETIARVQNEAGAKLKMSKSNNFYPGTTERVCLITGPFEAVRKVHNFIMEKIREKPDLNTRCDDYRGPYERNQQIKILVPNSTAGMIIGKGGNFIKQIKAESGVSVQISQSQKGTYIPERCVTIAGDVDGNRTAVDMILRVIAEDPQSGCCPNISYAEFLGPMSGNNSNALPFTHMNYRNQDQMGLAANNNLGTFNFGFNNFGNNSNSNVSNMSVNNANLGGGGSGGGGAAGGAINSSALENLKVTLRNYGFTDMAIEEIGAAMSTLANYGILTNIGLNLGALNNLGTGSGGLNLQGPQGSNMMSGCNTPTTSVSNPFVNSSNNNCIFGPVGSCPSAMENFASTCASTSPFNNSSANMNSDRFGGSPMLSDSFGTAVNYSMNNPVFAAGPSTSGDQMKNQMSFGHNSSVYSPTEDKSGPTTKNEIEVPETIVGAILGPGGKGIVELQQMTGTNIQISKKGVYVPGTRNRVVTITGTPNSITKAQILIQQRLQQEEMKRARQPLAR